MSTGEQFSTYEWTSSHCDAHHVQTDGVILELLEIFKCKKVLDLGCGNGCLTRRLMDAGYTTSACDPSPSAISIARQVVPEARLFTVGVYDKPAALGENDFDCVVSSEVIEHLYYPRMLPRFAARVLKRRGLLIITTPYYGYLRNLALSMFNRWDHHFTALWDHGHIKLFSRKTLSTLVAEEGFDVIRVRGVGNFWGMWRHMVVVAQRRD